MVHPAEPSDNEPVGEPVRYSVVVPAFSEAAIIEASLGRLAEALRRDEERYPFTEVVVVVADCPDDTARIARRQGSLFQSFKVVEPGPKVGKGRDVRAGMLAAAGEYLLFTDADLATPPSHVRGAFTLLDDGADVVIGVRPLWHIHNSLGRRIRSVVSNLMIRILAVPGIQDTQCGFKGFRRQVARHVFMPLETLGWGFDIEVLVRARALRCRIQELPILDWHDPKIGRAGLCGESDWHANLATLRELLHVSRNRLTGYYSAYRP